MKKTYWIYRESDTGKLYLQTANATFAKTVGYMCGIKYYTKKVSNGSTIYSFAHSGELEEKVRLIISFKNDLHSCM